MREITGNLLDQKGILVHQVNMQRVAGAGLALAIRQKWPAWYKAYQAEDRPFGTAWLFQVEKDIWVASFYAQIFYGGKKAHTEYQAFQHCCESLEEQRNRRHIFFPHGIGCGLAGGDWTIVQGIIARNFPNATIVRLP